MVANSADLCSVSLRAYFGFCRNVSACAVHLPGFLMHYALKKYTKPPYKDLLLVALGFGLLTLIFQNRYLLIGSGIALLACVHPLSAKFFVGVWNKLGKTMGYVNSRILLTLLFLFLVVPLALLYRISRKKIIAQNTAWKQANPVATDFTKLW